MGLSHLGLWQLGHFRGFSVRGSHSCPHLLHLYLGMVNSFVSMWELYHHNVIRQGESEIIFRGAIAATLGKGAKGSDGYRLGKVLLGLLFLWCSRDVVYDYIGLRKFLYTPINFLACVGA